MKREAPVTSEVLRTLREGEQVQLPDGETGIVVSHQRSEVEVLQPHKRARGPWIFQRYQVEPL